jgi:hypothetical protein
VLSQVLLSSCLRQVGRKLSCSIEWVVLLRYKASLSKAHIKQRTCQRNVLHTPFLFLHIKTIDRRREQENRRVIRCGLARDERRPGVKRRNNIRRASGGAVMHPEVCRCIYHEPCFMLWQESQSKYRECQKISSTYVK